MSTTDPTGAAHPLEVGDMLGQYKLVELLAIGGMGLVYRAFDPSLERYVAIKVLSPELASDPEIAQRFLTEARAAAALNHPNVVHVYTAGKQAGIVYFVMELVGGQQIETLLAQQKQLPVREAVEFIRQAALGLQHAHQHGLIHGDVKPANFLVSEAGAVKVTDFGLVRRVKTRASSTASESLYGTPGYISPEVIAGQPSDHRSDIYSLGATLFHMLAGQPPYVGATPEQTLRLHTQAPIPSVQQFNPNIPVALAHIVTRLLAKDPAARYQSYADLIQTLDRYLSERRLSGSRPLVTAAPLKQTAQAEPVAPHKSPFALAFTLISVVACLLIVYLVYRTQIRPFRHAASKDSAAVAITNCAPPGTAIAKEKSAVQEFKLLKVEADAALAGGQFSRADGIYVAWLTNSWVGPFEKQLVEAERSQLRAAARQQWQAAQAEIEKFRAAGQFAKALAVCAQWAHNSAGLTELLAEIAPVHQALEQARQSHVAAEQARQSQAAAEQAAAAEARQAQLRQLETELTPLITGLQWDKGRLVVEAAVAAAGKDAALRQELNRWQNVFSWLLALRTGFSERLKTAPSAPVTLNAKRGELKGQVTGFDADRITLRQTFGEAGFAELPVAWNELTAASICRLFVTGLDSNQPDEVMGYTVFIAEQALAKQARIDDARKTCQAVLARESASHDSVRAVVAQRYLDRLAEAEQAVAPVAPSTPPVSGQRSREADASALWTQLQAAATQNQWSKVSEMFGVLTNDFGSTEFVKGHTNELANVSKLISQSIPVKGFIPLDIGAACNAIFYEHRSPVGNKNSFRPGVLIGDLPDNGRAFLHDTAIGGVFQLRAEDKPDSIGITWATGRFPTAVTVSFPPQQQRRYAQLAVLSASSIGNATISVKITYDAGEAEELKFKVFDWNSKRLPPDAHIALSVASVTAAGRNLGQLYLNLIETDKLRRLTAVTFTWISASTEHPQHCVGIFSVSGLPPER